VCPNVSLTRDELRSNGKSNHYNNTSTVCPPNKSTKTADHMAVSDIQNFVRYTKLLTHAYGGHASVALLVAS